LLFTNQEIIYKIKILIVLVKFPQVFFNLNLLFFLDLWPYFIYGSNGWVDSVLVLFNKRKSQFSFLPKCCFLFVLRCLDLRVFKPNEELNWFKKNWKIFSKSHFWNY